jgi:hypothetical protein
MLLLDGAHLKLPIAIPYVELVMCLQTALAEKGSGEDAGVLESDSTPTKRGARTSLSRRDRDLPPAGKDKGNLDSQVQVLISGSIYFHTCASTFEDN